MSNVTLKRQLKLGNNTKKFQKLPRKPSENLTKMKYFIETQYDIKLDFAASGLVEASKLLTNFGFKDVKRIVKNRAMIYF